MNTTASNLPHLIASRVGAGGGVARTVRYAVTSSTSQPRSSRPATSVSVAMSARGRNTRLIGSSTSSYGGQSSSRPRADCSPDGTRSARRPQASHRGGGLVADGGDLQAGERARVEAVLVELLADRLHRVDRGERDPLVAALDQPADRLVHLLRVARRLHRDGRHLLGHRAEAAQPRGQRAGLLLGARHQHPPAEQRLGLEPRQRGAQVDDVADHGDGGRRHPGRAGVRADPAERGDHGLLLGGGADAGHRDGGVLAPPGVHQRGGDIGDRADRREQHEGAVVGVLRPVDLGLAAVRRPRPHGASCRSAAPRRTPAPRSPTRRRERSRSPRRPSRRPAPPRGRRRRRTGRRPSAGPPAGRSWPASRAPWPGPRGSAAGRPRRSRRRRPPRRAGRTSPDQRGVRRGTSVTTTSAVRSRSTARTVSSSGSPGPLPTNATNPTGRGSGRRGRLVAVALRAADVFLVVLVVC